MVAKWQHGKVYFWRKEKIVSLKLFQYLHLLILSVRNLTKKRKIVLLKWLEENVLTGVGRIGLVGW